MVLEEAAPAKLNLYLRVVGRRADHYHLLDSLAVFPAVGDRLSAAPADGLSLELAGDICRRLAGERPTTSCCAPRAGWPRLPRSEAARALGW